MRKKPVAQVKISSEADYLRAHLTILKGEPRLRNPGLREVKRLVTSALKKGLEAALVLGSGR